MTKATVKIGTRRLKRVIARMGKGDVISDKAFNKYANGVTKYSLAVWDAVIKELPADGFYKAEMTYRPEPPYNVKTAILHLYHNSGVKVKLHGVNSGYSGEGPRGTFKVLTDIGFKQADIAFKKETFLLRRRATANTLQRV
ncbi:hypothetical protein MKY96_33450 [Paenibacillus sp. FSL R7-0302]|uniref:hypothetical protein n=1 Tax=Paenibacillus sp. FSL R7-0302 TaxID=2921681 RepID=UPI0030F83A06